MRNSDEVTLAVTVMIGIVGVLLMALSLASVYGSRWTVLSQDIAPVAGLLGLLALAVSVLFGLIRWK